MERERIHQLLIDDAKRGPADIAAGHIFEADEAVSPLPQRRATAAKTASQATTGKAAKKKRD